MRGKWIREMRTHAGLSQEELAGLVGLHRNSIANYEGGADLPLQVFFTICEACDMKPWEMVARMLEDPDGDG